MDESSIVEEESPMDVSGTTGHALRSEPSPFPSPNRPLTRSMAALLSQPPVLEQFDSMHPKPTQQHNQSNQSQNQTQEGQNQGRNQEEQGPKHHRCLPPLDDDPRVLESYGALSALWVPDAQVNGSLASLEAHVQASLVPLDELTGLVMRLGAASEAAKAGSVEELLANCDALEEAFALVDALEERIGESRHVVCTAEERVAAAERGLTSDKLRGALRRMGGAPAVVGPVTLYNRTKDIFRRFKGGQGGGQDDEGAEGEDGEDGLEDAADDISIDHDEDVDGGGDLGGGDLAAEDAQEAMDDDE